MEVHGVRHTADEGRTFTHAPDVTRIATGIVNTYLVGDSGGWVLVDTGIAGFSPLIQRAAETQFGAGTRPAAIVLTHGHFDHAGNADALAALWSAPVYAHPLEMPYLTGRSNYPPPDPTVGGAMAAMSRVFPTSGRTLDARLIPLEGDRIPEMPGWRWIHTPGHTAGHVSLFRDTDGTLLAGDAIVTMNTDSWVEQVLRSPEPCYPPTPLTPDWIQARRSVETIASLQPRAIASGHGYPSPVPPSPAPSNASHKRSRRLPTDDTSPHPPSPVHRGSNGFRPRCPIPCRGRPRASR